MRTSNERQATEPELSEHELSEIRMLIEERTGICFDQSRERFFVGRVREHLRPGDSNAARIFCGRLAKPMWNTKRCWSGCSPRRLPFFGIPAVYEAFQKRALPELHIKKFWKTPRTSAHLERGLFHGRRTLLHCNHYRRRAEICGRLEC